MSETTVRLSSTIKVHRRDEIGSKVNTAKEGGAAAFPNGFPQELLVFVALAFGAPKRGTMADNAAKAVRIDHEPAFDVRIRTGDNDIRGDVVADRLEDLASHLVPAFAICIDADDKNIGPRSAACVDGSSIERQFVQDARVTAFGRKKIKPYRNLAIVGEPPYQSADQLFMRAILDKRIDPHINRHRQGRA